MQVEAPNIHPDSRVYFHTPSPQARLLYLYPLCVGDYKYLPGYSLQRDNYPGYSIMLITSGTCHITTEWGSSLVEKGQIALLNGYKPHSYYSEKGLDSCWLHFDGVMAKHFYHAITEKKGDVITLPNNHTCKKLIQNIYKVYDENGLLNEAVLSKYLTDILTELLSEPAIESEASKKIHESIHFMNEHLHEPLTIAVLAAEAYLSPYYYIRLFKQITGCSPHDYLLNLRITHAKYYLKTTEKPIKEIAFSCGFSSESSFCNTFRKRIGSSPGQYRGTP